MSLYRLAVCEDDPAEGAHLLKLCDKLLSGHQIPHMLRLFENADLLAKALAQNSDAFDLLLLDIQMEGKSGMALAKELYRRDFPGRFLFITGCTEYALEGYEVHPVHYLLKPVEPALLEEVLLRDWKAHRGSKTLLLRSGSKTLSLPVDDIRYMESRNHTLIVHTDKEDYTVAISLSEAETLVPPGVFHRCHNSFLVHLQWVEEIRRTALRLRDGTELPIGRRYYQSFQTALIHFINQSPEI